MQAVECPGLPADWLNAWLAAIGLLVLEPRLRLSWTPGPSPMALLAADGGADPIELAASSWPRLERLNAMPVAEQVEGTPDMRRQVTLEVFRHRAASARNHADSWALSSTVTDLCVDVGTDTTVRHARLDPKGPGTTKWLHHRLLRCHSMVDEPSDKAAATLKGSGKRVKANGLGFDATRIPSLADSGDPMVDPVIEVLAFFGLWLFPMRGDGVEVGKSGTRNRLAARQRCWSLDRGGPRRGLHMTWPAWTQPLDCSGVDALIDLWCDLYERMARGQRIPRAERSRLGIHSAWRTVSFLERGTSDTTVGLASTPVELDARR